MMTSRRSQTAAVFVFLPALLLAGPCAAGGRPDVQPDWIRFVPWDSPAGVTLTGQDGYQAPQAPPHGLFGHLDLSAVPQDKFPVTVDFITPRPWGEGR